MNLLTRLKYFLKLLGVGKLYYIYKRRKLHPIQKLIPNSVETCYLGTDYGGWHFVERNLYGSTIISAGLGEDGSFDLEFARKYDANVIILDPTPRSIDYFNHVVSLDRNKDIVTKLHLVKTALWNSVGEVKFFSPPNNAHVSHSIINFQNDYADNTDHINVSATTIDCIISDHNLDLTNLPMLKLDIEGAEIEVLEDMLKKRIFPKQILVEFDELNIGSKSGAVRVNMVHEMLTQNGYQIVYINGSDFSYLRKEYA